MATLRLISHTHWDREWHEPFQVFRLRLGEMIDKVLDLFKQDPDYRFFMLDGQTIVLEDYLELRPERESELRALIAQGRILVGPWYVLPDLFLVSGEALIRNLQRGIRIAESFGRSMPIGYVPDPFGHTSQMPQILKGFSLDYAMFRRGLADEPTELWWEGADGTRVLTTYLRDGYDNGAWLPRDPEGFIHGLQRLVASLDPYSVTDQRLIMLGTDHMQPWPGLPELMRAAQAALPGATILHSNLVEYARAVEQQIESERLVVVKGELRNPKRHHLLPGVTSTRMWIKQRNAYAQNLLEQWAEPLAAVGMSLPAPLADARPELRLAWKYLLQNHPHDSICGCSIDQVHEEMRPRFDWVEQIGEDIVERSLATIEPAIDTAPAGKGKDAIALVVFNPGPGLRGDEVTVQVDLDKRFEAYRVVNSQGETVSCVESNPRVEEYARVSTTPSQLRWMIGEAQSGTIAGYKLRDFDWHIAGSAADVEVTVSNQGEQDLARVQQGLEELNSLVTNPSVELVNMRVHSPRKVDLTFFASDLPGYGYRTFWVVPGEGERAYEYETTGAMLENECLRVEANLVDGTLTVTDRATGAVFQGVNRLVDGGDRGDLYNYCAPRVDALVNAPTHPPEIQRVESNAVRQRLEIRSLFRVPVSLSEDRNARSDALVDLPVTSVVTLHAAGHRVDFETTIDNRALDHRLQVEFPTPVKTDHVLAGQAFDLVARSLVLPAAAPDWVEQPVPGAPMQQFVTVRDDENGAVLAGRGLPEYEARCGDDGTVTLALTLLRSVGWLSRPDLTCRQGDAGPEKQTPGAQEIGVHRFEYSFIPCSGSARRELEGGKGEGGRPLTAQEAELEARAYCAPLRAVVTNPHAGLLPGVESWVEVDPSTFVITACKPPEEGRGMVVRGFNSTGQMMQVRLEPFRRFARAERVDLGEHTIQVLERNESGAVRTTAKPHEIVTVLFAD